MFNHIICRFIYGLKQAKSWVWFFDLFKYNFSTIYSFLAQKYNLDVKTLGIASNCVTQYFNGKIKHE